MKARHIVMGCFAAAVFSFASTASAQQFNGPTPANGACFYDDINYGGQYVCVEAGGQAGYVNELNDKVSSVKLFGNAKVTVYEDAGFRGTTREISESVPDLRNGNAEWNDLISSVKVASVRTLSNKADTTTPAEAEHAIRSAYQDLLGREPDPEGLKSYTDSMVRSGMTETEMRAAIRRSPEYRATLMVRQAYQRVLRREPDPAAQYYVDRVMKDHWSQAQLEQTLRNSDEYRALHDR